MKVAIYCRLSEEDRNKQNPTDDSESIQNQKSLLIEYAMEKRWDIYNIYSDDDYTGADRNRPAFNQLLKDAEARKFDIILCKTQSRFTREIELVEKYLHYEFPRWGIRFVSVVDNADTANKGNKKSRQINGLVNEWYLEDMSENIKSVLTNRRKNGFHIGAFALYGYKKDPQKRGHLVIDEEAAEVVREVFSLFAQGYGKSAIARMLNARDIPNPTEYKRLHNLRYSQPKAPAATLWKYFAIADMLENEIYIGNMVQGKYGSVSYKTKENKPLPRDKWIVVKGTHEPIIPQDLWDSVQRILREKARPFSTGKVGVFARKVKCAHCGYTMRSSKSHGRHYLKCGTRYADENACIGAFIPCATLEELVISKLKRFIEELVDENLLAEQIQCTSTMEKRLESLKANATTYGEKAAELSGRIKELYIDKTKGIISEETFIELYGGFAKEKQHLENLVEDTKRQIEEYERRSKAIHDRKQIVREYLNIKHLSREIVVELIDHIVIGRKDPTTREIPMEIHWNI
jgi:site-specific DNA recombinase